MATSLKFTHPFNFSACNLALEWEQWRTQFEWFITATRKGEKDEDVLVGVLLSLLGREGLKIYGTFVFATPGDDKKIKAVLDRFSDYFEPLKSEVFDRFRFHKRHQKPGEPFDAWLVELWSMVKSCNYGTEAMVNSILRDQIVLGWRVILLGRRCYMKLICLLPVPVESFVHVKHQQFSLAKFCPHLRLFMLLKTS